MALAYAHPIAMFSEDRVILSLCDFSGSWSRPYAEAGYTVHQLDLKTTGDIRLFEYPGHVHGILAAPPCTHFAVSGARWWSEKTDADLLEALSVVDACLRLVTVCQPKWWAIENPVGRLTRWIGEPAMYFDPYEFGDPYTKKTGLWGRFNMALLRNPVEPVEGSKMWAKYGGVANEQRPCEA